MIVNFVCFIYETSDVFLPLATVGSALHDPDRLCQKQPDRFLPGLSGSRCECSSSLPPALVSTSLSTEVVLGSFLRMWVFFCVVELLSGCLIFQVDASWCSGWLQSSKSRHPRSWSPLLLLLCVLYQVCLWSLPGYLYPQFEVSLLTWFLISVSIILMFSSLKLRSLSV